MIRMAITVMMKIGEYIRGPFAMYVQPLGLVGLYNLVNMSLCPSTRACRLTKPSALASRFENRRKVFVVEGPIALLLSNHAWVVPVQAVHVGCGRETKSLGILSLGDERRLACRLFVRKKAESRLHV